MKAASSRRAVGGRGVVAQTDAEEGAVHVRVGGRVGRRQGGAEEGDVERDVEVLRLEARLLALLPMRLECGRACNFTVRRR